MMNTRCRNLWVQATRVRDVRNLCTLVLLLFVVAGCEPSPVQLEQAQPQYSTQVGDSVYWDDTGRMEFTDSVGNDWKLQRYGSTSTPYKVNVWKNGSYRGNVRISWSGSTATSYRFDNGDWAEADPNGYILNTSGGEPGGGGGGDDDGGGGVLMSPSITITSADGSVVALSHGPDLDWAGCGQLQGNVEGYAAAAISGALITGGLAITQIATKLPFTRVTRRAAAGTAGAVFATVSATIEWFDCLI